VTPSEFRNFIWDFYKKNKRDFPWRNTTNPYCILVSEVMLQQTQTSRVIEKYQDFIKTFPTIKSLADATNEEVLRLWQGLGYNRRGLYLKRSGEIIHEKFSGKIPTTVEELVELPGIGINTASSIVAFAYDAPVVFIETNIRRVFIHEFFQDRENVGDNEILKLVASTLPSKDIRDWYYALMDYGSHLGKTLVNPNRKSKHYKKQSTFEGSIRQTRGEILKILLDGSIGKETLISRLAHPIHFDKAVEQLINEGFVEKKKTKYSIKS
jgi:A/G-specific adenine glycosylase